MLGEYPFIERSGMWGLPSRAYAAKAIQLDGANEGWTKGSDFTGNSDGSAATFSCWVHCQGDGAEDVFCTSTSAVGGTTPRLRFQHSTTNRFNILARTSAGTEILNISSTNDITNANGWRHVLCSFDVNDTAKRHIYVDDVSDLAVVTTYTAGTIDFTAADWGIGISPGLGNDLTGLMADMWLDIGTYIDFSVESNRRKFISETGHPVYLGANGERPTGVSPILYLSGLASTWNTNKGTGGNFTTQGTPNDSSTSPSD